MTEAKFNQMWRMLSNYTFEITPNINEDILCKICKKIMIEPYAGSCGCRYCCRCIKDYIGVEMKHCPVGKEECLIEHLEMERNVHKDLCTRRNIANTRIKCPNERCAFMSKLEDIEEHFRVCTMGQVECPFESIGCLNGGLREDSMNDHLDSEELRHSQILVDAINNLRNDVNGLSQTMLIKDREINELKENLNRKDGEINNLREEIENNKREIDNVKRRGQRKETVMNEKLEEIQNELRSVKNNNTRIEDQNEIIIEDEIRLSNDLKQIKSEILKLKEKDQNELDIKKAISNIEMENARIKEEMRKEIDKIKNEIKISKENEQKLQCLSEQIKENIRDGETTIKKELEIIKTDNVKMKENISKKYDEEITKVKNDMTISIIEHCLNIKEDFFWIIKEVTGKNKNIGLYLSDSFYQDNYKLCLRAQVDCVNLYLSVIIMKGERDDKVQWPMKHTITVKIINQDNMKTEIFWRLNYKECEDKSLFCRPITDMNKHIYCGIICLTDKSIQDLIIVGCSLSG